MNQNEIKELIRTGMEELNRTLYAGKSEQLVKYMRVMAIMPHYSFRNCMLIERQLAARGLPPATMVLGFDSWKKLGRFVKKGQKGLGIVAPIRTQPKESDDVLREAENPHFVFRIAHVFDVSQTEGKALPALSQPTGDARKWLRHVERFIALSGAKLCYQPLREGLCGKTFGKRIVISESLEGAERLVTLVHEVAHFKMHSDRATRKSTTKRMRETEAEAVAGIVGHALGLDCLQASADYIQLHNGDAKQFCERMNRIQETAADILSGIRNQHDEPRIGGKKSVKMKPQRRIDNGTLLVA